MAHVTGRYLRSLSRKLPIQTSVPAPHRPFRAIPVGAKPHPKGCHFDHAHYDGPFRSARLPASLLPGPVPPAAWPKLGVLTLSNFVVPGDYIEEQLEPVLTAAAKAASTMPSLRWMHVLNGNDGKLGLLTYEQRLDVDGTATLAWKSLWQYSLSKAVKEAWMECAEHRRVTLSFEEKNSSLMRLERFSNM